MSAYQPYQTPYPPGAPQAGPIPPTPQPGYGQPYSYPPMPYPQQTRMLPEHPQATTILILGILGFVVVGLLGPVAWVMGNNAVKDCQAGRYAMTDQLRVGRILGIVCTILLIIGVVLGIIMLIVFVILVSPVLY